MNALDMVRIADNMRLLQQVERVTGRVWVTDADVRAAVDARDAFTGGRRYVARAAQ